MIKDNFVTLTEILMEMFFFGNSKNLICQNKQYAVNNIIMNTKAPL